MLEVDVIGLGAWSDHFASFEALTAGLRTGDWAEKPVLSPAMIPPRERRRAPQTVKMAVETMGQAFAQSGLAASEVSVITASSMGDMEITDYMCNILVANPKFISPTQFHNSVHNAAVGYWSISQSSHAACNAVAAGEYSGPSGLLEAAVLSVDAGCPVLLVIQEGLAPPTIMPLCASAHPVSLAMLFVPHSAKTGHETLARLRIQRLDVTADWPALPDQLDAAYRGNPAGRMLPLFAALAALASTPDERVTAASSPQTISLPLTAFSCLQVEFLTAEQNTV